MIFSRSSKTIFTILVAALAPVVWGSTYIVATELLPDGRPLSTATIRCIPAGLLLLAAASRIVPEISWLRLVILSALNIGAFQALLFVAAYRLPGGIAALVGALQPLVVLGLAWGIDRDRPRSVAVASAGLGVLGISLVFSGPAANWDTLGLGAALVGTLAMACGTFLSRKWRGGTPILNYTGWQLLIGGLMLLPLAFVSESTLPPLSGLNVLGYGYLCIVGTLFAYAVWFWGISRMSPAAVSALGLLSPITAMCLGWGLLGESMGARSMFGMLLVLCSVCVSQIALTLPRSMSVSTIED